MKIKMIYNAVFLALGITLFACSSGGDSTPPAPQTTTITGTVTAPGGAIASLEQKTFFAKVFDFVLPRANALLTGTAPVPNATVELYRIDSSGNQVGDVLESVTTDVNGAYSLVTNESPSSTLIVRVNSGMAQIRAIVSGTTVNIDPVSEYVLSEIEAAIATNTNLDFSDFTVSEIDELLAAVDAITINLSGSLIADVLQEIETAAGTSLASELAIASIDLTGAWSYVETSGPNTCGDLQGETLFSGTLNVTQTGSSITIAYQGDVIATGSLSGSNIVGLPLESGSDGEGSWVETSQTFTVSEDGNTVNGALNWTWTMFGVGFSCSGTDYVVMTRI